jgi:sulfite exporter TauE/SafE
MNTPRFSGGLAHHLLNFVAAVLILVGLIVCARGAILALGEINELYQNATDDALAIREVDEEERSDRIMGHALGAAWGLIPLTAGSLLLGISRAFRKRNKILSLGDPGVTHGRPGA